MVSLATGVASIMPSSAITQTISVPETPTSQPVAPSPVASPSSGPSTASPGPSTAREVGDVAATSSTPGQASTTSVSFGNGTSRRIARG